MNEYKELQKVITRLREVVNEKLGEQHQAVKQLGIVTDSLLDIIAKNGMITCRKCGSEVEETNSLCEKCSV